jgi:outer membrane biosynthesis protein TonB
VLSKVEFQLGNDGRFASAEFDDLRNAFSAIGYTETKVRPVKEGQVAKPVRPLLRIARQNGDVVLKNKEGQDDAHLITVIEFLTFVAMILKSTGDFSLLYPEPVKAAEKKQKKEKKPVDDKKKKEKKPVDDKKKQEKKPQNDKKQQQQRKSRDRSAKTEKPQDKIRGAGNSPAPHARRNGSSSPQGRGPRRGGSQSPDKRGRDQSPSGEWVSRRRNGSASSRGSAGSGEWWQAPKKSGAAGGRAQGKSPRRERW